MSFAALCCLEIRYPSSPVDYRHHFPNFRHTQLVWGVAYIYIYMYMGFQNSEMVFICGINHEEHMGISFMTVSDY
jgi:hypothetical protein